MAKSRRWKLQERPGHLVMRLARLMTRFAEVRISPLGVGVAGYPVLHLLSHGGELTQKNLTETLDVEQSSMAQLLLRLERDGFIARRKDPEDQRSSLIRLTPKARSVLPTIAAIMDAGNDLAVSDMSESELSTLLRLLNEMIDKFEKANVR
jgi:MarR family transcriptional regulator, transcriptional regulator for hemolysin